MTGRPTFPGLSFVETVGAVTRIVSGGQSGVDRAAIDAARELGIGYSGWCPRGGWAEDRTEPPGLLVDYPDLWETIRTDPAQRTTLNIRCSDATLLATDSRGIGISPGCGLTVQLATWFGRPLTVIDISREGALEAATD